AGRHKLTTAVFFVNDIATQVAQRCLQHIENEFRPRRSARWTRAQFSAELMLMLRLRKIAQHVRRRSEKDKASAFVEQDRFVKHLENFRAWLVNSDNDDLVVRHAPNDFHDVLGVLEERAEGGSVDRLKFGNPIITNP